MKKVIVAVVLTASLALGATGCGGNGTQTGPYVEEPTEAPMPSDDGNDDNLDDEGDVDE